MKTQQELMQAYWGPGGTVDMVKEYNAKHGCDVKPWKCVKNSLIHMGYKEHPTFIDRASCYTFALTILYDNKRKEHRPVFVYDRLWNGQHWVVIESDLYVDNLSWNQPAPKRTFKLNDVELPCPVYTPHNDNMVKVVLDTEGTGGTDYFRFETLDQAIKVKQAICEILSAARDKE